MSLQSAVTSAIHGAVASIRRNAIGYGICAVSAVAALILASWASVVALVPEVGPVYAPLIVAGFYLLVIAATLGWLQYAASRRQGGAAAAPLPFMQSDPTQRQTQFAQIAMILEAVMIGYQLSRRSRR